MLRRPFLFAENRDREDASANARQGAVCRVPTKDSALALRKRKNEETALAGDDDGEEAAVGRDGELAEADTVKDRNGQRLGDGDFLAG